MLHDIAPAAYNNDISFRAPVLEDKIVIYRGKQVLAFVEGGTMRDRSSLISSMRANLRACVRSICSRWARMPISWRKFPMKRSMLCSRTNRMIPLPKWADGSSSHCKSSSSTIRNGAAFRPLMVGHEYWNWYESSQYCGRCGAKTEHDRVERMMRCPACGLMIFPKVFPAVIVAITRPDGKVLATRYKGRPYANYALIAGYCEMGETVEQTVHREVMEEVGLRVKNLRYYKSQPWPDSSSLSSVSSANLRAILRFVSMNTSFRSQSGSTAKSSLQITITLSRAR